MKATFYNVEIFVNIEQRLVLNVDGDRKGGLPVTKRCRQLVATLITPFLSLLRRLGKLPGNQLKKCMWQPGQKTLQQHTK